MSYLLLETGDKIYLEDLTGFLLLEVGGFVLPASRYEKVSRETRRGSISAEGRYEVVSHESRKPGVS